MTLPLRYTVEQGTFEEKALREDGAGGADALVLVSVMRGGAPPHSGPASYATVSIDGTANGSEIPHTELFTIMAMWAKALAESDELPVWQQQIAADFFRRVQENVTRRVG